MKHIAPIKQDDGDILMSKLENTAISLGDCFGTIIDENTTKKQIAGSVFKLGFSLTKLTFGVLGFAIKNTPKAVVAVSSAKKDLVEGIEKEVNQIQKEIQEDKLREKIKQLKVEN